LERGGQRERGGANLELKARLRPRGEGEGNPIGPVPGRGGGDVKTPNSREGKRLNGKSQVKKRVHPEGKRR